MAKKTYVDVLGLKKGIAPEVVATFSTRTQANWHINNTFKDLGYDNLLTKTSATKGDKFVQEVVADDRESYIHAVSTMKITDMDTVETVTGRDTLLGYIQKGHLKNKTGLGKIESLETEEGKSVELEDLQHSVQVVYSEDEVYPLARIEKRLTNELLKALSDDEDEDGGEIEEEKKEETKPKKKPEPKPKVEKVEEEKERSEERRVGKEDEVVEEEEEIAEEQDPEEVVEEEEAVEDETTDEVVEEEEVEDIEEDELEVEDLDEDIEELDEDIEEILEED